MPSTDRHGRLSRAPVIYALAQVSFSPISKISAYIPDIQDQLRERYPLFRHQDEQIVPVQLANGAANAHLKISARWDFARRDNKTGYILGADALTYHSIAYIDSKDFFDELRYGLEVVSKVLNVALATRVGVRYVDLILPDDGDELNKYIAPSLLGFTMEGIEATSCRQQTISSCKTPEGELVQKLFLHTSDAILPSDLSGHKLTGLQEPKKDTPKASLDTDHYSNLANIDFNVDDVIARLKRLQEISSFAFKAVVTDYAWEKWK